MKLKLLASVLFVSLAFACSNATTEAEQNTTVTVSTTALASMGIDGMVCAAGCAAKIQDELASTEGVINCEVNFATELASIEYDPKVVSEQELIGAIEGVHGGDQYKVTSTGEPVKEEKGGTANSEDDETLFELPHVEFPSIFDIIRNFKKYE